MCFSSFQTDTHYAILSLLIKLADSPTNEDYAELEKAKGKYFLTYQ